MNHKDIPSSTKRRQVALSLGALAIGMTGLRPASAQSATDYPTKPV
jgi:hypothetical protein